MVLLWLILALFIPVYIAWTHGSSYPFAFIIFAVGVVLYIVFMFIEVGYIKKAKDLEKKYPEVYETLTPVIDETDFVPNWVVYIGMIAIGFILAGLIIAILLWTGIFHTK